MNKEEKTSYTASVLLAFIGLSLMYGSTNYLGPQEIKISEIDESMIGEPVQVEGKVENSFSTEKHLFFDLKNQENIEIAMFNTDRKISDGTTVVVKGDVSMYEGNLNIVAEDIS